MKNLLYLLLIVMLFACNPTVVFREPQPEGKKDLGSFPARYRGTYLELDDSSVFIITAERIFEKHEEFLAGPDEEILEDTDIDIIGDTLILKEMNMMFPVIRRNDSVFGLVVLYDTVFDLKGKGRLRKLGKNYFLNLPNDSLWMVLKLQFSRSGRAYLCDIDHDKETEIFEQHCNVEIQPDEKGDPRRYIMAPTAKELRRLLKLETFTDTTEYLRISQSERR